MPTTTPRRWGARAGTANAATAARVPCLPEFGFAHRRRVVRVGDFQETATCARCNDVQHIDQREAPPWGDTPIAPSDGLGGGWATWT